MLEKDYELYFIEKIKDLKYIYLDSNEVLEKRGNIENIFLLDILEIQLKKINKNISDYEINEVVKKIKSASSSDLIISNQNALEYLIKGVKIKDRELKLTKTVKIIDFDTIENNSFIITNQFKMMSSHPNFRTQISDIVIFINGLPVIIGELKNPENYENKSLEEAWKQIDNYQRYLKDLFVFNTFNFISNKYSNKFGTITSQYERYSNWYDKKNEDIFSSFLNGLFNKETVLTLIKNFIFFTKDEFGKINSKVISAYHQYYGVKEAISSLKRNDSNKGGIFWHTQGSGKSYSMIFLVKQYINLFPKSTILIITDRKDLDFQLSNTFKTAKDFLGQTPERIETIKELKEKLNNKKQNGIFLSTIQKFSDEISELSDRKDILIIADEAHRSHNINLNFDIDYEKFSIYEKEGNAQRLRKAFPNAVFIGFTGTPIEKTDTSTTQIFGNYISKYLMADAVNDGSIVDIFYEPRKKDLHLDAYQFEKIDKEYENLKDKIKVETFLYNEALQKISKKLNTFERLIENDDRIREISTDFINHYKSREGILKQKAMFVTLTRKCAIKYYKEIINQAPELEKNIKVIMTTNNQDDEYTLKVVGSEEQKILSAREFKDPNSDFKIE